MSRGWWWAVFQPSPRVTAMSDQHCRYINTQLMHSRWVKGVTEAEAAGRPCSRPTESVLISHNSSERHFSNSDCHKRLLPLPPAFDCHFLHLVYHFTLTFCLLQVLIPVAGCLSLCQEPLELNRPHDSQVGLQTSICSSSTHLYLRSISEDI